MGGGWDFAADVVVVGTGSAGAVVARRLVDAGARVLVLEAGAEDTNPAIHDPARSHELWDAEEDWGYRTVPQRQADGRRIQWPRGRVLGGSSALNGMIYARGCPQDYDLWAYLGASGWRYRDVLPLFKRSEDFDAGPSEQHGTGGPLHVLSRYEPSPVHRAIVAAAEETGIPFNPDYNDGDADGVSFTQLTIKDGVRQSTATAFLAPVRDQPRLTVLTGACARRLLLAGGRCEGVEWERNGKLERGRAETEVVLCAGAIESPRLLMLSGIGGEGLGALGIEVAVRLPGVGENLHDHALCPVVVSSPGPVPPLEPGLPPMQAHLFWRSRPGLVAPDVQPLFFNVPLYEQWDAGPPNGYTLMAGIVRPASRGSLRLRSADPTDELLIDPAYLACAVDLETLVDAVELCREIARQPALADWTDAELLPGPSVHTRNDLREYARRSLLSYHHQVGTCRMGVDAGAVVDPDLCVHGVAGLRVADASVIPVVPSANTNAPVVMIGERAAELIASAARGAEL